MKIILGEKKNYYLNNINGMLQIISVNLVASFAGLFIKRLNASDNLVSMLNSLPAFFSVIAIIFGTPLVMNCKNKKKVTSLFFLGTRIFYALLAMVPFLKPDKRALVFIILYGAASFPGSIANFLWQSFFADIFAPSLRGKLLSIRNSLSSLVGTVTTLVAGFFLSYLSSSNGRLLHYYQIIFFIAFIFGIFEVISLYLHKQSGNNDFNEVYSTQRISIKFLKEMLSHKLYVFFMISIIAFNFSWQMGWPLFLTYEVDFLHTNEMWSGIESTVNGIALTLGYIMWRKFYDKKGSTLSLTLTCIGMAFTPFLYSISSNIQQVIMFTPLVGIASAGVQLIFLNTLYEVSPRENRTSYIAFYNLATNLTLMVAPFVGMRLYRMTSIKSALIIIGILRLGSSLLFLVKPKQNHKSFSSCTSNI